MKYCIYLRVSTDKQGVRGLGVDGQRADILRYIGDAEVVGEFVEAESGMNDSRHELEKAAQLCEQTGATLVFAKLDRLGRDAAYLFQLRKRIKILDVSSPDNDPLLFSVRAGMAESERNKISERTSKALQAKIAKEGKYVNNPNGIGLDKAVKASVEAKKHLAENNANNRRALLVMDLLIYILLENKQKVSWAFIAEVLNRNGLFSSTGIRFTRGTAFSLWNRRHSFEFYKHIRPDKLIIQ